MELDTSKWSGEGAFTQVLVDAIARVDRVVFLRAEDAPATRSEADYNFVSNEIYVRFGTEPRIERIRRFGIIPGTRRLAVPTMLLSELEEVLMGLEGIGPPDYSDEGMLQYLRTERVIPPYQTRGYKLVELVRVYQMDDAG